MSIGLYDKEKSLIWNLIRDLCVVVFGFVVALVCGIIRTFTLTVFDGHKITRFKVYRIRKLTSLKLWFFHNFPELCKMLDLWGYMTMLEKKFGKKYYHGL